MIKRNNKYIASFGFTLIELMIALAIIAILTAIAYPSYEDSVRQARRADAQADIVQYSAFAERIFTEVNNYRRTNAQTLVDVPNTNFYAYTVNFTPAAPNPATQFTITATPLGGQIGDGCGRMTLDQAGTRTITGAQVGCW
jgi:type IV pilus assembly protein PilE